VPFFFAFFNREGRGIGYNPQRSTEPERVRGFRGRKKTLRGKPYEHFRHEIRPEGSEGVEHKEGNQTLDVFVSK